MPLTHPSHPPHTKWIDGQIPEQLSNTYLRTEFDERRSIHTVTEVNGFDVPSACSTDFARSSANALVPFPTTHSLLA